MTVCVATYGDPTWKQIADRAVVSVPADVPVVRYHGTDLCDARNMALAEVTTEFVCFLDADDELESGYLDAMSRARPADIRVPSVRYVRPDHAGLVTMPRVAGHHHVCKPTCLPAGNWIVIGAVARTQLLCDVGGFRPFDWSEDWDLWLRCYQAGAKFETVRAAVYRAHVRDDSRNRALSRAERVRVHNEIARANRVAEVPA